MLLVLVMAAVLWGIGATMGTPRRLRWGMIAGLWAAVTLAHLVLPSGHPIRAATGESAALWLMVGGAVGLVLVYRARPRRRVPRRSSPRPNSTGTPATSCCANWAGRDKRRSGRRAFW